jgi:hypothetical protein
MNTAIAIGTWRRPSRRALRRNLAALGAVLAAHALVLLVLVSGAHWMPQLVEPPVFDVQLLDAPQNVLKARTDAGALTRGHPRQSTPTVRIPSVAPPATVTARRPHGPAARPPSSRHRASPPANWPRRATKPARACAGVSAVDMRRPLA